MLLSVQVSNTIHDLLGSYSLLSSLSCVTWLFNILPSVHIFQKISDGVFSILRKMVNIILTYQLTSDLSVNIWPTS